MNAASTTQRTLPHPLRFLHHAFIPHAGNNHRPHALRPGALRVYSAVLIGVKVLVTAFLFVSYPTEAEFSTITASRLIQLTNESRVANGLASLSESTKLDMSAFGKAKDMLANSYFAHTGPEGKRPWDWIHETGYSYSLAGENLARDFSSAEATHNALMNSESHRANILNPRYTEVGASVVYGEDTVYMAMHFATPKETAVPTVTAPAEEPAVEPHTTAPAVTEPIPAAKPVVTAPVILTYVATPVDQSADALEMDPGSTSDVWFEFRNDGNTTWTNEGTSYFALNVTDPAERTSPFFNDGWLSSFQPTKLDQSTVAPGEPGRFTLSLTAPDEPGTYVENYAVVAENLLWLEGGIVTLPIAVTASVETGATTVVPPATTIPVQTVPETRVIETENSIFETITIPGEEMRGEVLSASIVADDSSNLQGAILYYARLFFLYFAAFLAAALLLNIIVRIRVQHAPTIIQTLVVLGLSIGLFAGHFHFLEEYINRPQIL